MIKIEDKHNCCGCGACVQVCPARCISFTADEFGFLYPSAKVSECMECGLCESVCPVATPFDRAVSGNYFAASNDNVNELRESSSGGIFSALGKKILSEGGAIFGAAFDEHFNVVHICARDNKSLERLRGSKYVQSSVGDAFLLAKDLLQSGITVLFSGTPCQIAGLKRFLGKDWENLFTVDIICHGVPAPQIWRDYLNSLKGGISGINFRDKTEGWKNYSLSLVKKDGTVIREHHRKNVFFKAFLRDYSLRPSCYECAFKDRKSGSDITLGDFWGIENTSPGSDCQTGTSAVLVNTPKGMELFSSLESVSKNQVPYESILTGNPSLEKSVKESHATLRFRNLYHYFGLKAIRLNYLIETFPNPVRRFRKILSKMR